MYFDNLDVRGSSQTRLDSFLPVIVAMNCWDVPCLVLRRYRSFCSPLPIKTMAQVLLALSQSAR